ncbi:hypothetical protein KSP39_PZI012492 [Platanthera zijinensis]|uniref:Uncharacterized protein n=1 Tax=Platanthera zijinensis TaxID=2320716 RepID=A0AAP0BEW8_9ASPA
MTVTLMLKFAVVLKVSNTYTNTFIKAQIVFLFNFNQFQTTMNFLIMLMGGGYVPKRHAGNYSNFT